jgi:hypothetical protein
VVAVDIDADKLDELNERLLENGIEHVIAVYGVETDSMLPTTTLDENRSGEPGWRLVGFWCTSGSIPAAGASPTSARS